MTGRHLIECAIMDARGDVMLLKLASEAFTNARLPAEALQHESVTTLLHAINRVEDASKKLEATFYGEDAK